MMWRWRICFEAAVLCLAALPVWGATVSGEVRLTNSSNSSVNKRKDFSGVAVWLSPPENAGRLTKKRVQMLQKDKRFTPHVLVIETGTTVDFPNADPIFHNAFSNYDGQIFDTALYPPGSSKSIRFRRAGIVRVFCNIHPSMSAVIVVVDSGLFGTTNEDGRFSISDVPNGAYQVHFFHERSTPEMLDRLTSPVSINSNEIKLQPITISETGYLPVAHKNKYGREYPPNAEEQSGYGGLAR